MKRFVPVILLGLMIVGGCRSGAGRSAEYHTIASDLHRDAERAHAENTRAVALIKQGKVDEAEKALKAALAADVMHGPAHNNLGKVYFHQRKYYLAAWEFQYASKLQPDHPEPRNNLGLVFEAVGKLDEAVNSYQQARALAPDNVQVIGNLARSRVRRGERSADVRELLQELLLRENRTEWRVWAEEQLAILPHPTSAPSHPTAR